MDAAHNLSNNIRSLRALSGLSQTDFAKELGISKSTLQEIEQGHGPHLSTVECIADHLGIPVSALISEVLPSDQMSNMIHLFQRLGWCSHWSQEDRDAFLQLAYQMSQIMAKYSS